MYCGTMINDELENTWMYARSIWVNRVSFMLVPIHECKSLRQHWPTVEARRSPVTAPSFWNGGWRQSTRQQVLWICTKST